MASHDKIGKICRSGVQKGRERQPLRCTALVQNIDNGEIMLELRFRRLRVLGGNQGLLRIKRSEAAHPRRVMEQLLGEGAALPRDGRKQVALVARALAQQPKRVRAITGRSGWHGKGFVTPATTFGSKSGLKFEPTRGIDPSLWEGQGKLLAWREGLREPCKRSGFLTFGIAVSFAAPLLALLDEDEGALFNLHGESSTGKSLVGRAALSVFGRASRSDLATYEITDRALEDLCAAHNDLCIVLDEQGRAKGGSSQQRQHVRRIAYMVAGGRGGIRSAKATQDPDLANRSWRVLGISSGETSLEDATEQGHRLEGERVRHLDISVPRQRDAGIFDRTGNEGQARAKRASSLAQQIEAIIAANFGRAGTAYLGHLVPNRERARERARTTVRKFVTWAGAEASAWDRRFAAKFGVVLAGAELAARYGVAPWTVNHARRSVRRVYRRARRSVASTTESAEALLKALGQALDDPSCFPTILKGDQLPHSAVDTAWGFRRELSGHGPIIALNPEIFERELGSKAAADAVLSHLIARDVVIPGQGGKRRRQIAVRGFKRSGRARWVCIREGAVRL